MRYLFFFFFLFISFQTSAQQFVEVDFTQLVNKTHTERTVALFDYYGLNVKNLDSTTIFIDIETVRQLAHTNKDDDFLLEADLMELYYYYYRSEQGIEGFVKKARHLIRKAEKKKARWLHARTESILGEYFRASEFYELAFLHLTNAAVLLEEQPSEIYPIKQIVYLQLTNLHIAFREYEQTIRLYKLAVAAISIHDRYYYVMHMLNGLGFYYRQLNMLDSSDLWFGKTYEKAVLAQDTVWQAIVQGNLGENYYLRKEYERAKPLLLQDLNWARSSQTWGNASNALAILADIHFEQGNIDKAEKLINEAVEYAHRSERFKRLLKVYPVLMKLSAARSDAKMVAAYLDSINLMNESIAHKFDRLLLVRAEQRLELERIAAQTQKVEKQRAEQLWGRNMLIVGLFIFLVAFGLFFNRHRLKTIEEKKRGEN